MKKVVLYRLVTDKNGRNRHVRSKGRKKPEGKLGSYDLRYRENGKWKWESVGEDLGVAERMLKERGRSQRSKALNDHRTQGFA